MVAIIITAITVMAANQSLFYVNTFVRVASAVHECGEYGVHCVENIFVHMFILLHACLDVVENGELSIHALN